LREGFFDKSKLALVGFEEGNKINCNHVCILQFERNIYRKYKEAAHILYSDNPISQPSLKISPVCFPLIENELSKQLKLGFRGIF
jgi:hypothetical protein